MKQKTGKRNKKRKRKNKQKTEKEEKGRNGPGPIPDQGCAAGRTEFDQKLIFHLYSGLFPSRKAHTKWA
jgi:hypothetical protein